MPQTVDSPSRVSEEEVTPRTESEDSSPVRNRLSRFFADFRHPGPWHVLVITAILALLGFGGLFFWRWMHRPATQSLSVVIADFENSTGNPQFDLALKTALTIDLQQSPLLAVSSRGKVRQTLVELKAPVDKPLTPEVAREVCSRIHDQTYLSGSIRRFARKYMVSVAAFDCSSGRSLAESKGIAESPDGIVAVLDKVAVDLRKQLGEPSDTITRFSKPLFAGRTPSLEALKAYADASRLGLEGKLQESVTPYQHALELDPEFALAFADLGVAYSNLGEQDLARKSLTRAYELRDTVDEPDQLFIVSTYSNIVTGDTQASIRNDKEWSAEYPRNPVPLLHLADLENRIGKPALAVDPAKRALQLNPGDAYPYIVLARAQLHLGQFEQAVDTCQLAIERHLDSEQIHGFLFQIAFLRLDQAEMDRQIAWAKDQPAEPYLLQQVGLMDFALGKAKNAQAVLESAADEYRRQGESELANQMVSRIPRIEAELGLTSAAHTLLARLPKSSESLTGDSVDVPVAWAHVGETARADALAKRELESHLTTTLWQEDFGPQIKAAIDLNQQRAEDAIEDLKPAIPYDLYSFDGPGMRGRAYLAAKQPDLAEVEFHKILDHPGIEPLSHNYPLAQLGLARALAAQGKTVEAGFAYKVVLQIWKDADADLPRLKEAKAEFARLATEPGRTSGETGRATTKPAPSASSPRKPSASRR
ncbi:tetratricopeptide repeat protein [Acidicapsa acidisoli]|uniref:tetratricopeptide repeat protein n=1 Tax=Acidicapsa acidisoli TaxID=1615681 RepID=UPI0021DFC861|nr:tetratricopeptide repeat protein [Acidicapsa acidisoli]